GAYCSLWSNSFGRVPSSSPTGRHEGTDIMSPEGQPVLAVADGVLSKRYSSTSALGSGYGWALYDEATNTTYRYFHMTTDPAGRSVGDQVRVGDVIGYVGDTGAQPAGNFHLHFEVRPNNVPRDPLPLLDIDTSACIVV
ncbi:MAG: M23 family metallopeptidase, partial [Ilumatobacteraceae bacterium]